MKFSRRFAALAVCALALVSIAAQACGFDVQALIATHGDVLTGLSMLAMAGELDPREVKTALEKISAGIKEQVDPLRNTVGELKAQVLEIEQKMVKKTQGGSSDGGHGDGQLSLKTAEIANSEAFGKFRSKTTDKTERYDLGLSIKALVNPGSESSNNTTVPTLVDRQSGFYGFVLPRLTLLDVLPSSPVKSNAFDFMQLSFTGDADTQLEEGDEKAEMEFDGDLVDGKVETIAVHTTTSTQVLDDVPGLLNELDRIMRYKVRAKVENQVLFGTGIGNRMHGLYTQAPLISTSAPNPAERIAQAASLMDTAGYTANVIVINPVDWFNIITTKDTAGNYIYGNPQSPAQPTLWNLPVIQVASMPEGTALVGNTAQTSIKDRMQPSVYMTRDHKDYASRNLMLILIEARLGLALYDVNAFRKVNLSAVSD